MLNAENAPFDSAEEEVVNVENDGVLNVDDLDLDCVDSFDLDVSLDSDVDSLESLCALIWADGGRKMGFLMFFKFIEIFCSWAD